LESPVSHRFSPFSSAERIPFIDITLEAGILLYPPRRIFKFLARALGKVSFPDFGRKQFEFHQLQGSLFGVFLLSHGIEISVGKNGARPARTEWDEVIARLDDDFAKEFPGRRVNLEYGIFSFSREVEDEEISTFFNI
jgi:hypothetical protein